MALLGQHEEPRGGAEHRRAIAWVLGLALALTVLRLVYLALWCPYNLVEDEAFYWEWSLRLDWSYATKGPGIAWAIWLCTELMGTSEFSVRAVAALSAGVSTLAVGGLAADVARWTRGDDRASGSVTRVAVVAALLWNATPVFAGTAILCTIDGPYVACWAVAAWAAWRAMVQGSRWAWLGLGAALGVGFLFKYTILLLPPGLLTFAWLSRGDVRTNVRGRGPFIAGAVVLAVLGLLPVVIWNSQHDWQTVKHLLGHLGVQGGDVAPRAPGQGQKFPLQWFLELVATQAGFLLPVVIGLIASVVWAVRRGGAAFARSLGFRFLLCCAGPILAFYTLVSLMTEPEANWPIGGYVTLLPLAALWLTDVDEPRGVQRLARNSAIIGGLIAVLVLARADLARDALRLISPGLASKIPIGRITGAAAMGEDAGARLKEIEKRTGLKPFVLAQHYGRASRLRFYLPGRPVTYCASSQTGGRKVQQDYWADADLADPTLLGRPALLVGGAADGSTWIRYFDRLDPSTQLAGEGKTDKPVFEGYGFRGFGK